jgi:hypothetical protein
MLPLHQRSKYVCGALENHTILTMTGKQTVQRFASVAAGEIASRTIPTGEFMPREAKL